MDYLNPMFSAWYNASTVVNNVAINRTNAMQGDRILMQRFMEDELDAAGLHDQVTLYKTNEFIRMRYHHLHQTGALPPGLQPPIGNPHLGVQDTTNFEAWIFATFQAHAQSLGATAQVVLPALGLDVA
jgi:hypothetical protein